MKTKLIVIVVTIAVVGAFSHWMITRDSPKVEQTQQVPIVPQVAIEPEGKNVNAVVLVNHKSFAPSSIQVNKNDVVDIYLTAQEDGISVIVASEDRKFDLKRESAQFISVKAHQNTTLICSEGCDAGVAFSIEVI